MPNVGMVVLNRVECCAIGSFHGMYSKGGLIEILLGIMPGTEELGFFPRLPVRQIYLEILASEVAFLKANLMIALPCGHSVEEHIRALRSAQSSFALNPLSN